MKKNYWICNNNFSLYSFHFIDIIKSLKKILVN